MTTKISCSARLTRVDKSSAHDDALCDVQLQQQGQRSLGEQHNRHKDALEVNLDVSDFFRLRCDDRNRGHQYKLFLPGSRSSVRHNFYTYRAARI